MMGDGLTSGEFWNGFSEVAQRDEMLKVVTFGTKIEG